jgi:heat-inducible transcriptional repressor
VELRDGVTPRRERVLKHVVEEYVSTAQPVASETVARKHVPPVSSATIRNEFAALEDIGLIRHPHTSAGRIPTDRGYRYYVERIMGEGVVPHAELRMIAHQFHQVETDVDEWVRLASSVLANALHSAAVVTLPGSPRARIRRLELVPLGDKLVLLAIMLDSGSLKKQLIHSDDPQERDDLVRLSNRLTTGLADRGAAHIGRAADAASGFEAKVLRLAERIVGQAEDQALEEVYYEGLAHMLAQPEFASSIKALPIVEALEHGYLLSQLLAEVEEDGDARIVIGQENPLEQMRETSAVLIRYALSDDVTGILGILGPTRLPYWRAVPLVRYLARLLRTLTAEAEA